MMNFVIIGIPQHLLLISGCLIIWLLKESIDSLKKKVESVFLYTHLGYYYKNGKVDEGFKK